MSDALVYAAEPLAEGEVPPSPVVRHDSGYASPGDDDTEDIKPRGVAECLLIHRAGNTRDLSDAEIVNLVNSGALPSHGLERALGDTRRAVSVRRQWMTISGFCAGVDKDINLLGNVPHQNYDYDRIAGRCAENVFGFMPLPIGVAGPLTVNGARTFIPMATTEGTLIASTSRGCKALEASGGVTSEVHHDAMTRAPCVRFRTLAEAADAKRRLTEPASQRELQQIFNSTSSHGRLLDVEPKIAGRYLYLRFRAKTGEAMGMNMLSKGCDAVLRHMREQLFPDMEIVSISGNYCTDKKPSALNWIEGRGKSVVAEAIIPAEVLTNTLKTTAEELVQLNTSKNYIGSALAGTAAGGFNAHAANIVMAIFLATGQDAAQVVTSSNCLTMMERTEDDGLQISVSMPSIEVGTIGGGTELPAQASMIRMMGCDGVPDGRNACRVASMIAAAVLAGELSLCSALATGDLVRSHMKFNRKDKVGGT